MKVLKDLPWNEKPIENDTVQLFINSKVNRWKLFYGKNGSDTIHIMMELSPSLDATKSSPITNMFVWIGFDDHQSVHAFLSDAKNGHVLNSFPKKQACCLLVMSAARNVVETGSAEGNHLAVIAKHLDLKRQKLMNTKKWFCTVAVNANSFPFAETNIHPSI